LSEYCHTTNDKTMVETDIKYTPIDYC
jgi:hypothetical protein